MKRFILIAGFLGWNIFTVVPVRAQVRSERASSENEAAPFLIEKQGTSAAWHALSSPTASIPHDFVLTEFKDLRMLSLPDSTIQLTWQGRILATPYNYTLVPYYEVFVPALNKTFWFYYSSHLVDDVVNSMRKEQVFQNGFIDTAAMSRVLKAMPKNKRLPQRILNSGTSMAFQQYGTDPDGRISDKALADVSFNENERAIYKGSELVGYYDRSYRMYTTPLAAGFLTLFDRAHKVLLIANTPELRPYNYFTEYPSKKVTEIIFPDKSPDVWLRIATAYLIKNGRL